MTEDESVQHYNWKVSDLADRYEALRFEDVHAEALDLIRETRGTVLDVGCGSGRDAAWFAQNGWDVIAIDPAERMLEVAKQLHPESQIRWLPDKLPGLEKTLRLGVAFDLIMLSAVWMHIQPDDRPRAFRKLVSLLKPAGLIVISLRHGSFYDTRKSYPVSVEELEKLAQRHGVVMRRVKDSPDRLARSDVKWQTVCLQLPDDGTEALPLLRHTILNDSKSSTYKLALLRVLVRIADSAIGIAEDVDDDYVKIPLGLVALYWIRMYKPLIEAGIPQRPTDMNSTGLGFVKEAFHNLKVYAPQELRVGASFSGTSAESLCQALIDARDTIKKMPAYYITYPNSSEQVFKAVGNTVRKSANLVLSAPFLWSFGELHIPRNIWLSMCRFACWIEPLLVNEWINLMQTYGEKQGNRATYDSLMDALVWLDPERDTALVRDIGQKIFAAGRNIYCVWSGKRLEPPSYDIDHCFPFAAWPCGDLWNLLPSDRRINQREKGDKLVSAATLEMAAERILQWWETAYCSDAVYPLSQRFANEARVSLPLDAPASVSSTHVWDGMLLKRFSLKRDLQISDWDYKG